MGGSATLAELPQIGFVPRRLICRPESFVIRAPVLVSRLLLVTGTTSGRTDLQKEIKDLYDDPSKIVHGGTFDETTIGARRIVRLNSHSQVCASSSVAVRASCRCRMVQREASG